MLRGLRRAGWIGAGLALLLVAASCSFVRGPVTGPGDIALLTGFDVTQVGYERSEFFLGGLALSYRADRAARPATASGSCQPDSGPPAGFNTRMVVYRPSDPARFNGTVVVEWLNVTAGLDLANDWVMAHTELIRSGCAWVGRVGPGGRRERAQDQRHRTATASSPTPATATPTTCSPQAGRQIRVAPATGARRARRRSG